jgi:adenylyltransferase/sulfurtransferase
MARYSRHLILPEVGVGGQLRLREARVLLVGAGGLGAPLGMYLAAAGVGTLGLVDFDAVDHSNLQRQVIHGTKDVGRKKVDSARETISDINPNVRVECHETRLTAENALQILDGYDLVIDGTDNFPTRYLVNDACVLLGKPNVYGSIYRFEGQLSVFGAPGGPCYRCLYPDPPPPGLVPSCAEGGVLGILPGIVGCLQATEAIKWILGKGESMVGRLLVFDALATRFTELRVSRDPDCPVCGEAPTIHQLVDYDAFCGVPEPLDPSQEMSPGELRDRLAAGDAPLLLDVRNPPEWELCRLQGAILVPLAELTQRLHEIPRDRAIVAYCKMGGRSAQAVEILTEAGYERVTNLAGGLDRWTDEVDPDLARY